MPRLALGTPFRGGTVQGLAQQVGTAVVPPCSTSLQNHRQHSKGGRQQCGGLSELRMSAVLPTLRALQVLRIARGGLERRGMGEEDYLAPLEEIAGAPARSQPPWLNAGCLGAAHVLSPHACRQASFQTYLKGEEGSSKALGPCLLLRLAESGATQAERLLRLYQSEWGGSVDRYYAPEFSTGGPGLLPGPKTPSPPPTPEQSPEADWAQMNPYLGTICGGEAAGACCI